MQIIEEKPEGRYQVQSYQQGQIVINRQIYTRSLIVGKDVLIPDWRPQSIAELEPSDWKPVIELKPQLVLLGTGADFILQEPTQMAPLYDSKLPFECMSTEAACRTLVALLSEGRLAIAALFIGP